MRKIKIINVAFAHKDADILYSIEDLRKMSDIPAEHLAEYELDCMKDPDIIGFVKYQFDTDAFIKVYREGFCDYYELGEEINS